MGVAAAAADNAGAKEGIAPLLLARCNSLLVQLSEYEKPTLVDSLVLQHSSKLRLLHFIQTTCKLAQHYLNPLPYPPTRLLPHQTAGAAAANPSPVGPDGKLNLSALNPAQLAALQADAWGLTPGESQLVLSVLRLMELASDDSSLRDTAMQGLAGVLATALTADSVPFAARCAGWCANRALLAGQHCCILLIPPLPLLVASL